MATDKRSRQRANRAIRQAEEAKAARRGVLKKRIRRFVFWGVIIGIVILLAALMFGGGGGTNALGTFPGT